jgi:hypothetical protein
VNEWGPNTCHNQPVECPDAFEELHRNRKSRTDPHPYCPPYRPPPPMTATPHCLSDRLPRLSHCRIRSCASRHHNHSEKGGPATLRREQTREQDVRGRERGREDTGTNTGRARRKHPTCSRPVPAHLVVAIFLTPHCLAALHWFQHTSSTVRMCECVWE